MNRQQRRAQRKPRPPGAPRYVRREVKGERSVVFPGLYFNGTDRSQGFKLPVPVAPRRHRTPERPAPGAVCFACGGGEGSIRYEVKAGTQLGAGTMTRRLAPMPEAGWEVADAKLWIGHFPYEGGEYQAIVHQWNACMERACDILFEAAG